MLTHLYIQHYALINSLDIDFDSGMSVLIGETGAGKSIILGALALVMGARADTKTIMEGEDRCVIEATFRGEDNQELLIRRELNSNGRSRSFVNDEVVSAAELKDLSGKLIDIHSQHENLLLRDDLFQLGIVDAIAHNETERNRYKQQYVAWLAAKQQLADLVTLAAKNKDDADYIAFQYNQLKTMHLEAGELDSLNEEHYRLSHAEELKMVLQETLARISDEGGAVSLLHGCKVSKVSEELQTRIDAAEIELKDIADELTHLDNSIEVNPARLEAVEERIAAIEELLRKHKVETVDDLLAIQASLEQQLTRNDTLDEQIAEVQRQVDQLRRKMSEAAFALTQSRKAVVKPISERLIKDLTTLNIRHANIDIAIMPLTEFTENGSDNVQFLFAANLNQTLRPVSEVASGGEIARLMLCLKSLVASINALPTIIFDEIDTGVGGETATQMGRIMHEMSGSRQIIAITHLPQIAAQADRHYKVYKEDTPIRTETHVRALTQEESKQEIKGMIDYDNLF